MTRPAPWPAVGSALVALVAVALIATGCRGAQAATGQEASTESVSAPARAVRVEPVEPGGRVGPSPGTPAPVAAALAGDEVIVVAFLYHRAADDRAVHRELAQLQRLPAYRSGVRYFIYPVGPRARFGDLPDHLGVTGTPAVVVIGRDRTLANRWIGLVDLTMLQQAVNDASSTAALNPAP